MVSLNGLPRRKLLKAFDSSYKNFKASYFKVASRRDVLAFFLDNKAAANSLCAGARRRAPSRGWNTNVLSLEDQLTVDLLKDCLVLESSALIKCRSDQKGMAAYMGRFLSCFSFSTVFICCLPCLFSVLGKIAPKMIVYEVR